MSFYILFAFVVLSLLPTYVRKEACLITDDDDDTMHYKKRE